MKYRKVNFLKKGKMWDSFSYTAINSAGKEVKGTMNVDKEADVNTALRVNGYFPTGIKAVAAKKFKEKKVTAVVRKRKGFLNIQIGSIKMPRKELVLFTRQLPLLPDAGLTLVRALRTLEKQSMNKQVKRIIGESADYIEGGFTFSEALTKNPKTFDQLVKAGESVGAMEIILSRLADFMEKNARIISKIKSAMIYPTVVLAVAGGVTMFLMVFIVPKFEKIFSELLSGMPLPGLTTFVLSASQFFVEKYIHIIVGLTILIIGYKIAEKTKKGKIYP